MEDKQKLLKSKYTRKYVLEVDSNPESDELGNIGCIQKEDDLLNDNLNTAIFGKTKTPVVKYRGDPDDLRPAVLYHSRALMLKSLMILLNFRKEDLHEHEKYDNRGMLKKNFTRSRAKSNAKREERE